MIAIFVQTFLMNFNRFGYGANTSHYPFNGGVHHSDDLIYLFPYPWNIANLNEADREMSQILLDLWTSFAKNGTPQAVTSDGNTVFWPSFSGKKQMSVISRCRLLLSVLYFVDIVGPFLHINKTLNIGGNYVDEFAIETREPSHVRKKCF